MFRKPMRLEKWIAFDGALGAEAIEAAQDAEPENDNPDIDLDLGPVETGDDPGPETDGDDAEPAWGQVLAFEAQDAGSGVENIDFKVMNDGDEEVDATFSMPTDVDVSDPGDNGYFFPFWGSSDVNFNSGSNNDGQNISSNYYFFELSGPDDGSFSLYAWSDSLSADQFVADHGLDSSIDSSGTWVAFDSGQTDANGNSTVIFKLLVKESGSYVFKDANSSGQTGGGGVFSYTPDGGLRFVITDHGYTTSGNNVVMNLLRSLVFTPEAGKSPSQVSGFGMAIYYEQGANYNTNPDVFGDGDDGAYQNDNPTAATPSYPIPTDPGPGPDPTPDPDPDPTDPIIPPIVDGGDGDDSGDDASGDGDDASGQDGMGDDAGDAGDDMVFIYRREDAAYGQEAEYVPEESADGEIPDLAAMLAEGQPVESAMLLAALEFARDIETWMTAVRDDRQTLEIALSRLQTEYLSRPAGDWRELRDVLRDLFQAADSEKRTVNKLFDQLREQVREFNQYPLERRDGILNETLRELALRAVRRSGEAAAFSKALDQVTEALLENRVEGDAPPDRDRLLALFNAALDQSLAGWRQRVARSDPIGQELAGKLAGVDRK